MENQESERYSDAKEALQGDDTQLRDSLADMHAEDIAELAKEQTPEQAIRILKALPSDDAADVLGRMSAEQRDELLEELPIDETAELLSNMSSDDRADVIQELDPDEANRILSRLETLAPEAAEDARKLIAYPEESAGGLMTTEYVALPPTTKIGDAIHRVREYSRQRHPELIYYIYVTNAAKKLIGILSLRDLILAEPEQTLADVMVTNFMRVDPTADQEEVARTIAKYDLSAVPVTGPRGRILGVVTVDDVMDVVIEEATEDAQRMAAVEPIEAPYLSTNFSKFMRKRAPWLVVLFFGGLVTASVLESYERDFATTLALVAFIPLIISSGGNSGAQSSSLVIRALAVGELKPSDWWRVIGREVLVGLALGVVLGLMGFLRAYFFGETAPQLDIALTVGGSILAVVVLGTSLGAILPLGIQRLGMDPAVSSTPFIASLIDIFGLILYFSIARLMFSLMF